MKKPIYIREAETQNEIGDRIVLYYHINEKSTSSSDEPAYGVGITMYTQRIGERTVCEKRNMEGIFKTISEAKHFADRLCNGLATPVTLEYIVEDIS